MNKNTLKLQDVQKMTRIEFFTFCLLLDKIYSRTFAVRVFEANCVHFGIDSQRISDSILGNNYKTLITKEN